VKQAECRNQKKIFLAGKVFNTSVENFVENSVLVEVKFLCFNAVLLFAQFLCNSLSFSKKFSGHRRENLSAASQREFPVHDVELQNKFIPE
jgi:hypothetical protein